MGRSPSSDRIKPDRGRRAVAAGVVLLAHVALIWLFLLPHIETVRRQNLPELVIATILEQPRPRNLSFGPVSLTVKTENVLHLQRLAPRIQDIPVDEPDPALTMITEPQPASAALPLQAESGMNGDSREASGESGGGNSITLLQRVIPRYPVAAARRRQAGATGVMLRVDSSGRVSDVKITRSSGSLTLDAAAVEAFRQWKFAPVPSGTAPDGVWVKTEQRFILYRFRYSRLGDKSADSVEVGSIQPASDVATPGSQEALTRFISEVSAGTLTGNADFAGRLELQKMRSALDDWGAVKSIHFTGIAGPSSWTAYRVRPGAADGYVAPTVEVRWNLFEVQQEHATTEWLIAVDRHGGIWAARASPAPWL